jgi:hypothetical protein
MSYTPIVPKHEPIRNFLQQHRLPLYFSKPVLQHIVKTESLRFIDDACAIASTMPVPLQTGYILVDTWYTCPQVINSYAKADYSSHGRSTSPPPAPPVRG